MEQIYPDMPWMKDILQVADIISNALRSIGYEILKALAHVIDACGAAVNGVLGIDITKISPIQQFAKTVTPVAWAAITIAIILAGIYIVLHGGKNKALFQNMLLSVILIVAVPFMFTQLNAFKNAGVSDISTQMGGGSSIGMTLLQGNVTDVGNSLKGKTTIDKSINPYYIDINMRLPKEEPFNYKIESVSGSDQTGYKLYGEPLGNGFFGMGEERLYAYQFDFIFPLAMMIITIIAMVFAGLKVARTVFDLTVHQVIAPIVFATDINNGARTKKFIQSLFGSVIMMVLVLAILKIFLDLSTWVNQNISDMFVRVLMIGGAAWGVIDGPDVIVKLLGVDAGVRSASSVLLGAAAVGGAAKSFGHTVGAVAHGATQGVRAAAGGRAAMSDFGSKMKRGASAFKDDAKAVAAGGIPDNDSLTDYAKNLHRQTDGSKGFAAGYNRFSNVASMAGYAMEKMKSGITGSSAAGAASSAPSVIGAIQGATGGTPLESAASAAALKSGGNTPPRLSGGSAVVPPSSSAAVTTVTSTLSQLAQPVATVAAAAELSEDDNYDNAQIYASQPTYSEQSYNTPSYRQAAPTSITKAPAPQIQQQSNNHGIWPGQKSNERK